MMTKQQNGQQQQFNQNTGARSAHGPTPQALYNQVSKVIPNEAAQPQYQQQSYELQNFNFDKKAEESEEEDKDEDFKILIDMIQGNVQIKRMEDAQMVKIQSMDQYYDLLPFNVRGFKLINRASLLEANFTDKYILKQTQDLNLDLHKGQFESHNFVKAAVAIVKNVPCWSFFMSLVIFVLFMLHSVLDSMVLEIISTNGQSLVSQLDKLKGIAHTSRDDLRQSELEDEVLAIEFLIPLIIIRLLLWMTDLVVRVMGLHFFRKKYMLWTLLLDFLLIVLTVMIGGFFTRLNQSLDDSNQSQSELIIRNFMLFFMFILSMIQARKALVVMKRLSLLYYQQEPSCCDFEAF